MKYLYHVYEQDMANMMSLTQKTCCRCEEESVGSADPNDFEFCPVCAWNCGERFCRMADCLALFETERNFEFDALLGFCVNCVTKLIMLLISESFHMSYDKLRAAVKERISGLKFTKQTRTEFMNKYGLTKDDLVMKYLENLYPGGDPNWFRKQLNDHYHREFEKIIERK
jgi:hypothetical protein